jgi:hypothetical protein
MFVIVSEVSAPNAEADGTEGPPASEKILFRVLPPAWR